MSDQAILENPIPPLNATLHTTQFVAPSQYHGSPFGGFRVAADLVFRDNVHFYPGPATAYDPEVYGFEQTNGTATHVPAQSAIRLAVAGASGDKSRLRTHDQVRYQAGAASLLEITAYQSNAGNANQSRKVGLFDDNDGVYFETLGTTNYLCVRSSTSGAPVVTSVAQTAWNGHPYDDLDVTKGNRFRFVLAWLGVEGIQCFINGRHVPTFSFSNTLATPYMKTATLPISVEISNSGASTAASITYICSTARILNGNPYPMRTFGFSAAKSSVAATMVPLMSFRVGSTLNAIASRVQVLPRSLTFFAETQPGAFALVLGSTLTGATFAATSPSGALEIDTAATAMSGGTQLFYAGQGANTTVPWDLTELFTLTSTKLRRQAFTGTADVLTVGVVREGAVSFDPRASMVWGELR
jgi:hypothetical protein